MSARTELQKKIGEQIGIDEPTIKHNRRFKATTVHELYRQLLNEEPVIEKGAPKLVTEICRHENIDLRRTLASGNQALPTHALKQLHTSLQQQ